MTEEHNRMFVQLQKEIKQVVSSYKIARTTLEKREDEIKELREFIKILKDENTITKEKYNTLKTAKSFIADTKDNHEAKIKINQMLREIDKCIALLNS